MVSLQIKVFLSSLADKPVFERILSLPSTVNVPYSQLESSLRFLFGLKCLVSFNVSMV